jgi:CheY-like chemotaxis protein
MNQIRVLLIDDSVDDVELTTHRLLQAGLDLEVRAVANAFELQEELILWMPNIVVSDVRMPLFDGFEALEVVRTCAPAVPFVLLCGNAERIAAKALACGAYAVVDKDRADNLPHVIASAVASARPAST